MDYLITGRRLRLYKLRSRSVVGLLRASHNHPDCITLGKIEGPPEDAEVVSVTSDWEFQTVMVLMAHPSFPEVTEGHRIPIHDDLASVQFTFISRQKDGSYRLPEDPNWDPVGPRFMIDSQQINKWDSDSLRLFQAAISEELGNRDE